MTQALAPASIEANAVALQRARGTGRLTTQAGPAGRTRIATLYQEGAAKIRLPHTHGATLQAVLINTAGGLTGGDHLTWQAEAAARTHLVLTTPACERVYRSLGADAKVAVQLAAGLGARLDWLPQETILFEGSRLDRQIDVELAPDATLLAVEAVLLGRTAMGEAAHHARLADRWRVRRGGRLLHAEATRLSADPIERQGLSLLDGALAFATILYIAADAAHRFATIGPLTAARGLGASLVGDRLVVRALAPSGLALRRAIIPVIAMLSSDGSLPRLWTL